MPMLDVRKQLDKEHDMIITQKIHVHAEQRENKQLTNFSYFILNLNIHV
jgi:hypothetical protein